MSGARVSAGERGILAGAGAVRSARSERVCAQDPGLRALVRTLVAIARTGLPRMLMAPGTFARSLRRAGPGARLSGTSPRSGAIVLLGLARSPGTEEAEVLGGTNARAFLAGMWERTPPRASLGDLALLAWGASELGHPLRAAILARLEEAWATARNPVTGEAAWTLAALSARPDAEVRARARAVADALKEAVAPGRTLFAHWVRAHEAPWSRRHQACFADQAYALQALSMFHRAHGDRDALELARRCAATICELQGPSGQWWWHYDVRADRVIEGYPVYSVHQDALAPMALLDHEEAGGDEHLEAIRRGLRWFHRRELEEPLIDEERGIVWRKIARNDPRKLVRVLKTLGTRVVPGLELAWLDHLFPPSVIDHECRPCHLGWILRAWQA